MKPIKGKLLVVAGGTGGHIFPALAVAEVLQHDIDIHWLGSFVGMEKKIIPGRYLIDYVSIYGVRGHGVWRKLFSPCQIVLAVAKSLYLLLKIRPDAVLCMGGFACGPAGIAAWLLRKPLIIHEQNAIAGYTNRILSKFAKQVLQAFPEAFPSLKKAMTVGNPVRASILQVAMPAVRFANRQKPIRLLILGGSLGAKALNTCLMHWLPSTDLPIEVWHQTGEGDYSAVVAAYAALSILTKVTAFIEDMVAAYEWADLVICRAGALTVSEIADVGLAAIFIPLPHAVDNHQYYNAKYLQQAKAAIIIQQSELTPAHLQSVVQPLVNTPELLWEMAGYAKTLAKVEAAQMVAACCRKEIVS